MDETQSTKRGPYENTYKNKRYFFRKLQEKIPSPVEFVALDSQGIGKELGITAKYVRKLTKQHFGAEWKRVYALKFREAIKKIVIDDPGITLDEIIGILNMSKTNFYSYLKQTYGLTSLRQVKENILDELE